MHISIQDLSNPNKKEQYRGTIEEALINTPENPDPYVCKAILCMHDEKWEDAIKWARKAVGFDPNFAGNYTTLAGIYGAMGDYAESKRILSHARKISRYCPAINWNYSLALLMDGRFTQGWDLYRWRKVHLPGHRRMLQEEWDFTKKVRPNTRLLVWCEQGLGDIIMMLRFLPLYKEKFGFSEVYFECHPELYTLVENSIPNVDQVYCSRSDFHVPVDFDEHCSLLDSPFNFGIDSPEEISGKPYLKPQDVVVSKWADGLADATTKIGICWEGSATHQNNYNRSAKLTDFEPLAELGTLIGLQKEGCYEVPESLEGKVFNCSGGLLNADYTAALLKNLDFVVTVDTFIAHLAGSLGVPTLMILPYAHEWRWGTGEGTSYWYDSVQMFRQKTRKDWSVPIKEVCNYIKCHTQPGLQLPM